MFNPGGNAQRLSVMNKADINFLSVPPNKVGEGIVWCERSQCLWWVDIRGPHLFRYWTETGHAESWPMPQTIGCLALTECADVIVALTDGLHRFNPETGGLSYLTPLTGEPVGNRPNDGAVSRAGRFYIGTMPNEDRTQPNGRVHSFDGASVRQHLDALHITNGLAFSPDDRTAYLSDSWTDVQRIWAFDHNAEDGSLHNRRLFFDCKVTAGRPDGACVDTDGCYWMAGVGGAEILRLTPAGKIDIRIPVPVSRPSKPCFGGPNFETLFVTSIGLDTPNDSSDGRVLAIHTGFQGVQEGRCALPPRTKMSP